MEVLLLLLELVSANTPIMLDFPAPSVYQLLKCYFTYGQMSHVVPTRVPEKGKPWAAILNLDFIHKIDLVLPNECYQLVQERILQNLVLPAYYRVTMSLPQILERGFFNEYIKNGTSGHSTPAPSFVFQESY